MQTTYFPLNSKGRQAAEMWNSDKTLVHDLASFKIQLYTSLERNSHVYLEMNTWTAACSPTDDQVTH